MKHASLILPLAVCLLPVAWLNAQTTPAERLSGRWHLNEELSRLPGARGAETQPAETPRGRGGAGRDEPAKEGQLQLRAMIDEAADRQADLVFVATEKSLSIIDSKGTIRKFSTSGAKDKLDLFLVTANVTTRWDDLGGIKQEITSGQLKLTRTYVPSDHGAQLVVTSLLSGAPLMDPWTAPTRPAAVRLVYDRVR